MYQEKYTIFKVKNSNPYEKNHQTIEENKGEESFEENVAPKNIPVYEIMNYEKFYTSATKYVNLND